MNIQLLFYYLSIHIIKVPSKYISLYIQITEAFSLHWHLYAKDDTQTHNFSNHQEQVSVECSAINMNFISHLFYETLGNNVEEQGKNIEKVRGQKNSIFWTRQGRCTHKLNVVLVACIRHI